MVCPFVVLAPAGDCVIGQVVGIIHVLTHPLIRRGLRHRLGRGVFPAKPADPFGRKLRIETYAANTILRRRLVAAACFIFHVVLLFLPPCHAPLHGTTQICTIADRNILPQSNIFRATISQNKTPTWMRLAFCSALLTCERQPSPVQE